MPLQGDSVSESETFSSEEWSVIESALFRYQRRIEETMADEGRTRSNLLDMIKSTNRKISRLRDNAHKEGTPATPVEPVQEKPKSAKDPGRWGQGGPGSDDYFSFAD